MAATLSLRYRININYPNISRMRLMENISTLITESGYPVSKYCMRYSTGI